MQRLLDSPRVPRQLPTAVARSDRWYPLLVAWDKQQQISREVDRIFPKDKGNLSQQGARAAYNAYRLSGVPIDEAVQRTVAVVRKTDLTFHR
jgi:hypothetical protein